MEKKTGFEKKTEKLLTYAEKQLKKERSGETTQQWLRSHQEEALSFLYSEEKRTAKRTLILVYAVAAGISVPQTDQLLKKQEADALYVRNLNDFACMWTLSAHDSAAGLCKVASRLVEFETEEVQLENLTIRAVEQYLEIQEKPAAGTAGKMTAELQQRFNSGFQAGMRAEDVVAQNRAYFTQMRERTRVEFLRVFLDFANSLTETGSEELTSLFMKNSAEKTLGIREKKLNLDALVFNINDFFAGALLDVDDLVAAGDMPLEKDFLEMTPEERKNWFSIQTQEDEEEAKQTKKCVDILSGFMKQGKRDISRTLFIACILYFNSRMTEERWMDLEYFNCILDRCGWEQVQTVSASPLDNLICEIFENDTHLPGKRPKDLYEVMVRYLLEADQNIFTKYEGADSTITKNKSFGNSLLGL